MPLFIPYRDTSRDQGLWIWNGDVSGDYNDSMYTSIMNLSDPILPDLERMIVVPDGKMDCKIMKNTLFIYKEGWCDLWFPLGVSVSPENRGGAAMEIINRIIAKEYP